MRGRGRGGEGKEAIKNSKVSVANAKRQRVVYATRKAKILTNIVAYFQAAASIAALA